MSAASYNGSTQTSSSNSSRNAARNSSLQSLAQRWLEMFVALLRILLFPLTWLSNRVFPGSEYDGLSAAVTSKASLQFVNYLQTLQQQQQSTIQQTNTSVTNRTTNTATTSAASVWLPMGFAAARSQAVQDRALVFLYLHSPQHRMSDHFCRHVLCNPSVQTFLQQSSVTPIGVSIHTGQGAHLQQVLHVVAFPFVALLQPTGTSSMNVVFRAEGRILENLTRPEQQLLPVLQQALTRHQVILAEQEARRLEREQEAELRRQQDEEYQAALRADQERERLRLEEQERVEQEKRHKEQEEMQRQEEEELSVARAMSLIRPEPATGGTMIRFVLPTGAKINRRFESDETIEALRAFVHMHCRDNKIEMGRVGLSTNFPRKSYDDLAADDPKTLAEAGLSPQAVLMVQDLDA